MKSNIIIGIMVACGLIFISACYYDNPLEPDPVNLEEVSFSTHIIPIMEASCSTANCHDGTSEPDLRSEVAYAELIGGYVNLLFPLESVLVKSVEYESGVDPMPPGGPQLSALDRELITLWVIKGGFND